MGVNIVCTSIYVLCWVPTSFRRRACRSYSKHTNVQYHSKSGGVVYILALRRCQNIGYRISEKQLSPISCIISDWFPLDQRSDSQISFSRSDIIPHGYWSEWPPLPLWHTSGLWYDTLERFTQSYERTHILSVKVFMKSLLRHLKGTVSRYVLPLAKHPALSKFLSYT